MAPRFLVLALALAAPAPLLAAKPAYREFQDWVVACDNVARCEMLAANDRNELTLSLLREAGPDGPLRLRLEAGREIRLAALRLDGDRPALNPSNWQHSRGDGYAELTTDDPDAAAAFLRAIRNGNELRLGDDEPAPRLSLTGISAALLFLDEAQGRLGNVTALLRTGDGPADTVPGAPAAPRLRPAASWTGKLEPAQASRLVTEIRRLHAGLLDARDCLTGSWDPFDTAEPLGPDEALVMIECGRGAYQSWHLVFRAPLDAPAHASPVSLPLPLSLGGPGYERDGVEEFINVSYSPEEGMLFHSARGRAMADCGESAAWIFDGDDFQLQSLRYLNRCTGGAPGEWPRLWTAQETVGGVQSP